MPGYTRDEAESMVGREVRVRQSFKHPDGKMSIILNEGRTGRIVLAVQLEEETQHHVLIDFGLPAVAWDKDGIAKFLEVPE